MENNNVIYVVSGGTMFYTSLKEAIKGAAGWMIMHNGTQDLNIPCIVKTIYEDKWKVSTLNKNGNLSTRTIEKRPIERVGFDDVKVYFSSGNWTEFEDGHIDDIEEISLDDEEEDK